MFFAFGSILLPKEWRPAITSANSKAPGEKLRAFVRSVRELLSGGLEGLGLLILETTVDFFCRS